MSTKTKPPAHLSKAMQTWFAQITAEFVLEDHHVRLLVLACESWDRAASARRALKKHGMIFTDRFGQPRSRPENKIEHDGMIRFARLLRELGLDVDTPTTPQPPRIGGQQS